MKKIYRQNYVIIALLLAVVILIMANCGGSDGDGYVAPNLTQEAQPAQQLVSKDVAGFLYHLSSISSSGDGEEEEVFSVLDVPIIGEEGFLEQVNQYITETSLSRANPGDREELLTVFTEEASRYQPLPSWSPSVQLFGLYDDNPVPLNSDGSFAGTVSAGVDDETVGLEIFVSEENCYEVKTISESDLTISSSESVSSLKSCPKQIIIKPGECRIFEVFAKPSVNLKDANLDFTLANPEYGCVLGPIFIKCRGGIQNTVGWLWYSLL